MSALDSLATADDALPPSLRVAVEQIEEIFEENTEEQDMPFGVQEEASAQLARTIAKEDAERVSDAAIVSEIVLSASASNEESTAAMQAASTGKAPVRRGVTVQSVQKVTI